MTSLLDHALQYAGRGWPVFRLNTWKRPFKGSHGFKDATTDPAVINAWWAEKPWANIGLATGDLVVFDCDGAEGLARFRDLADSLNGLPRTLVHRTPSGGFHFVYRTPSGVKLRSSNDKRAMKGGSGLDIKAHGGYVVLPPSTGKPRSNTWYSVEIDHPIAELTDAMVTFVVARGGRAPTGTVSEPPPAFGGLPPWLRDIPIGLAARSMQVDCEAERPEFERNLMALPVGGYDHWFKIGAAIHDFDSSTKGLELFVQWSFQDGDYGNETDRAECEAKWLEYEKPKDNRALVTKATVYGEAKEAMQNQRVAEAIQPVVSQHITEFRFTPLPPQRPFEDFDQDGNPRGTCLNTSIAIQNLGISCRKDVFHEKMMVGGHAIQKWAGDLSDDAVHMVRRLIRKAYGFEPGEKNARDAAVQLCLENQFNPVTDYLDGLVWDGKPRLGTWLTSYLGAEDTALNRETGRLVLLAAVRRAYEPGVKFDQIMVLEGVEGRGKSSAIEILAGTENYSDQRILTLDDRGQQEAIQGVWLFEIADLAGMRRAEVETVKAFASRTWDRARPAYGRMRIDRPRQGILIATTNDDTYLKSQTGNRRFWPVLTGTVDLAGLRRDRDQLWAEAVEQEATGATLTLDPTLWRHAGEQQESRTESDPWHDDVRRYVEKNGASVSIVEVLTGAILLRTADIGQIEQTRCARILKHLGLERYRQREGERLAWRYRNK